MPPTTDTTDQARADDEVLSRLDEDLAGLDALELAARSRSSRTARLWRAAWPKLGAVALGFGIWQLVVWSGWRPTYLLPPPSAVFGELADMVRRHAGGGRGPDDAHGRHRLPDRRGARYRRRAGRGPGPGAARPPSALPSGPADHAVGGLGAVVDPAVQAVGRGDPVRDRHRGHTRGGQRADQRQRPDLADPAAGRAGAGGPWAVRLPPRGPAGLAAGVRGRAQAGWAFAWRPSWPARSSPPWPASPTWAACSTSTGRCPTPRASWR